MRVTGSVTCDSAEVMLDMVRAGLGVTRLQRFLMEDDIASGALIPLLEDCHETEPVPITALTPPGRENLPRIRAFIDFLIETWR
jgi:DNA-binding transcriptional LysR family regulator